MSKDIRIPYDKVELDALEEYKKEGQLIIDKQIEEANKKDNIIRLAKLASNAPLPPKDRIFKEPGLFEF